MPALLIGADEGNGTYFGSEEEEGEETLIRQTVSRDFVIKDMSCQTLKSSISELAALCRWW